MEKSQQAIRPVFILWLLLIFGLIPLVASLLLPANGGKTKAMIAETRNEVAKMAVILDRCKRASVSSPCNSNGCLLPDLLDAEGKAELRYHLQETNAHGEMLDLWRMPFHVGEWQGTNTVVRSAGPNRQFGDRDDIVYDSAKSAPLKP